MSIPRTLLLSATRPGESSVGEVFLRDLCRHFPQDKLCCFAPTGPDYEIGIQSPDLSWIPMEVRTLPKERVVSVGTNRLTSYMRSRQQMNSFRSECKPLIADLVKYAREQKAELIWAVLSGPAAVHITREALKELQLPLISLVWDPLEYVLESRGYDPAIREILLAEFAEVMKLSQSCGVASEGMKESLELRYGVDCQVLINSVPVAMRKERDSRTQDDSRLIIGFAGSLYALGEMQALIEALSSVGWQIENRAVTLRILGNAVSINAYAAGKKCSIEFLGYYPTPEAIEKLSEVDVAYLPYWFASKYAVAVRQCFPNKFSTYLAAGCPTLFHGPKDSSPTRFLEKYPVGISCHSLDSSEIVACLKRFVVDDTFKATAAVARQQVLAEELNPEVTLRRFAKLFNLTEGAFKQGELISV